MFVTYTPEGETPQSWVFDPGRVRQSEAAIVEKAYKSNWESFCNDVQAGSVTAQKVLLWHLMRREHPTLRLDDVPDFYAGEVVIEQSAAEWREIRDRVEKSGLPAAEIEQALLVIDAKTAAAEDREDVESGKATSNTEQ